MNERRLFVKGVDLDTTLEYIENGKYRYAKNVHLGITDTGNAGTIENCKGNTLVTNTNISQVEAALSLPSGTLTTGVKTIGSYDDILNKRVIFFNYSSIGYDQVLEYSYETGLLTVIYVSIFMNLDPDYLITGINIVNNNLLYWTDDKNEPRKINIDKAKLAMSSGFTDPLGYSSILPEVIRAIKYPPLFHPTIAVETDVTTKRNNIRNKNFQFKYRYIKDDGEKSAFSPISEISVAQNAEYVDPSVSTLPSLSFTANRIRIDMWTGINIDEKIELAVRQGNTGDFYLFDTYDKSQNGWGDNQFRSVLFYNDKILTPIAIRDSIQLFDNLPRLAKAQDYIDGNRLVYGNIFEGYNNPDNLDVSITPTYTNITTSATFLWTRTFNFGFAGAGYLVLPSIANGTYSPNVDYFPLAGDVIIITGLTNGGNQQYSVNYILTQADVDDYYSNGAFTLRNNLVLASQEVLPPDGLLALETYGTPPFGLILPPQAFSVIGIGTPTLTVYRTTTKLGSFKSGAVHPFGIVYYDFANRSGTTVRDDNFDVYAKFLPEERPLLGDYIQQIGMDWSINHLPPDWATHYQWVYAGNTTVNSFVQFIISDFTPSVDGQTSTLSLIPLVNFNAANPTDSVISYSFTKGDRCRFLTNATNDAYGLYLDVEVIAFTAPYLSIQVVDSSGISIVQGTLIEIYTPKSTVEQSIYYEFSQAYEIGNAGTANAYHKGELTDQVVVNGVSTQPATGHFDRGDVWIRPRHMNKENVTPSVTPQMVDEYVEDYNISDFYISNFWDKGRPNRVSEEEQPLNGGDEFRELRRPTTIVYSDVFVPETNINGLSRFYDFNFEAYDQNYGSIQKLFSYEKRLECYQERKVGAIPIRQKVALDDSNNIVTYQTEQVLNQIVYFQGNYGIAKNPESFASFENRRYFVDINSGFIVRLSTDGITPISQTFKIHSYVTNLFRSIVSLGIKVPIYGVYNKAFGQYELAIEQKTFGVHTIGGETFAFCEPINAWTSWYDYEPENMCSSNQDIVTFKNGLAWTHNTNSLRNNFYGTQYSSEIWVVGNQNPNEVKVYNNVSLESTEAFEAYEITNNQGQLSNLITSDFELYEGKWYASFWKDQNTPNITNPLIDGDSIRDSVILLKLRNSSTGYVKILAVNIDQTKSFRTL